LVIFDCNGVLVDSEPIASARGGFQPGRRELTPETVAREFHGRRTADIFVAVEKTTKRSLPPNFAATVAAETLRRFRDELQPMR
jgi:beta-phosphoglucomutase-like phosphatase (HAD superfamily)